MNRVQTSDQDQIVGFRAANIIKPLLFPVMRLCQKKKCCRQNLPFRFENLTILQSETVKNRGICEKILLEQTGQTLKVAEEG